GIIEFPTPLESILGLTQAQGRMCNSTQERLTIKGELPCDLQTGIHALYIYCDLLQFTHVGHIKAPLLRVVDSGEETGGVVTRYYERPRYVPLQKKNFDSIQIVIRDDLGEKIQFESGKVLLTLHFRRAQNNYLIRSSDIAATPKSRYSQTITLIRLVGLCRFFKDRAVKEVMASAQFSAVCLEAPCLC